jgi:hypothetical protein
MDKKEEASIKALLHAFKKGEVAVKMQIQSFWFHCKNVIAYDNDVCHVEQQTLEVIGQCKVWIVVA